MLKRENNDTDKANQLLLNKGNLFVEPFENIEILEEKVTKGGTRWLGGRENLANIMTITEDLVHFTHVAVGLQTVILKL